jgi:DNA invertase Pin-like site-specific DNA recombinase
LAWPTAWPGTSTVRSTRRNGPRSRADIEAERAALAARTQAEIDALLAEFHARLPRAQAEAIGAIYARYSTRFQDSIADQVRTILEEAVRRRIFVPRENVFFDLAVRGAKEKRDGLGQLRALLAGRKTQVLLLFATNRLFRKAYKALEFVDQAVKEWGVRCVFVKNGIDTDDKQRWETHLHFNAMVDQFAVSMYGDNVRAAHEGLMDKRLVFGTVTFGYTGEPIDGQFTKRKRARCRLVVDPDAAKWVTAVFEWFVRDGVSVDGIIQRLNSTPEVPLPPRCGTGAWTRTAVLNLLGNTRYRGLWRYGAKEAVWLSAKDYARQTERPEPLREEQIEELRIVPDELWFAAQKRLAAARENAGRKPKDAERADRPRMLNGFFWCPEHNRPLYVGGAFGTKMYCPACRGLPVDQRPLYSQLDRPLALRLTCQGLARLIEDHEPLVKETVAACQHEAAALQRPDPARLAQLRTEVEKLTRAIDFNRRNVGATVEDQADTARLVRELGDQRAQAQARLRASEDAARRPVEVPTEGAVRKMIGDLACHLQAAAEGTSEEQVHQAREILRSLTGGRIELYQMGERKAKRGWLQGRFRARVLGNLVEQALGRPSAADGAAGTDVMIDYCEPDPMDAEAERAKRLYDQGLLSSQIAAKLGCGRNWVTKLLQHWHAKYGVPMEDGRKRRASLARKQAGTALYEELADAAKALWDAGHADVQIAERLGCSPPTAAAAVAHAHTARGLPAPSHAQRREALVDRMMELYEANRSIRDIAGEVSMCTRSVTLLLRKRFAALGRPMADGRGRRADITQAEHQRGADVSEQARDEGPTTNPDADRPRN